MYLKHMPLVVGFVGSDLRADIRTVKVGVLVHCILRNWEDETKRKYTDSVYSREELVVCGVVDRRELDGKEMERKRG